jgi:CubicO group peptidase (beta-lactamase class C family)
MRPLAAIDIEALAAEYDVPGAAVGLLADDQISDRAVGVLSTATQVAATPDSLFQIGSITKLWTATVIMQLAEQEAVHLDDPVIRYLPDFTVGADREQSDAITIRHLLTHTSGISDDYTPTTRGDDAVARYVADVVPGLALEFRPGEDFMYSNAGYVVLGCVAESVSGRTYSEVLREQVAAPLDLRHWAPIPEEALLFRTAVGHVPAGPKGRAEPTATWSLSAAHAPAGSQVAMTAAALLQFAGAYLRGGRPLVSAPTADQMWTPVPNLPEVGGAGGRLAIGGVIQQVRDTRIVAYDGATQGQSASMRMIPEKNVAVVSMANGGDMFAFHQAVLSRLVAETTGIELPTPPMPPQDPEPADAAFVDGRYRGHDLQVDATVSDDGRVSIVTHPLTKELAVLLPTGEPAEYVRLSSRQLIGLTQTFGVHPVIALIGEPSSPATAIVHFGRTLTRIR